MTTHTDTDTVAQAVLGLYLDDPHTDLTVRLIAERTGIRESRVRAALSAAPARRLDRYKVAVEVYSRSYPGMMTGTTSAWAYRPSREWLAQLLVEARKGAKSQWGEVVSRNQQLSGLDALANTFLAQLNRAALDAPRPHGAISMCLTSQINAIREAKDAAILLLEGVAEVAAESQASEKG
jgi:hypothetical protein